MSKPEKLIELVNTCFYLMSLYEKETDTKILHQYATGALFLAKDTRSIGNVIRVLAGQIDDTYSYDAFQRELNSMVGELKNLSIATEKFSPKNVQECSTGKMLSKLFEDLSQETDANKIRELHLMIADICTESSETVEEIIELYFITATS